METETKAVSQKLTVRCQFCNTWNRIDASKVTAGPKCGKCGKPILLERPIALDDETFTRTINESDVPIAVDFAIPIMKQPFDTTQVVSFSFGLLR